VKAHDVERNLPRDQRQVLLVDWARMAFGEAEAASIPQRGLRLLEEAIEAFQASGGDEAMAHKFVTFVFERPVGTVGQELGGVAVTVLLLAAAAGLSADEEECREVHRVLSKPLREFTERNANKNAAGFLVERRGFEPGREAGDGSEAARKNPCCGNVGTHGEGGREYCLICGQELA
jgi:NTP pyrophosphatase (non-canonical NTP hydrolase)